MDGVRPLHVLLGTCTFFGARLMSIRLQLPYDTSRNQMGVHKFSHLSPMCRSRLSIHKPDILECSVLQLNVAMYVVIFRLSSLTYICAHHHEQDNLFFIIVFDLPSIISSSLQTLPFCFSSSHLPFPHVPVLQPCCQDCLPAPGRLIPTFPNTINHIFLFINIFNSNYKM